MANDRRTRRSADAPRGGDGWLAPLAVFAGAALVTADIYERRRARDAERERPARGRALAAGGASLHYVDIGRGRPVVLLHGIATTLEDWFVSGIVAELSPSFRIVAVDRPGSGYSSRPAGSAAPERQADALAVLLRRLGAEDAVVVGHSFGSLVALALALRHPRAVHALVLVAPPAAPGAPLLETLARIPEVPLISGIARATVTPTAARALAPSVYARLFEPQPVTERFREGYPLGLACRPSQLRASTEDAASVDRALRRLIPAASGLACPVAIVSGSGDGVFDPDVHARPLAAALGAALASVPAGGHMVHHSFPTAVAGVIRDAAEDRLPLPGPDVAKTPPRRGPDTDEPTAAPGDAGAGGQREPGRPPATPVTGDERIGQEVEKYTDDEAAAGQADHDLLPSVSPDDIDAAAEAQRTAADVRPTRDADEAAPEPTDAPAEPSARRKRGNRAAAATPRSGRSKVDKPRSN